MESGLELLDLGSVSALAERLRYPRYEALSLEGIQAAVRARAAGVTVTVTASPRRGLGATLELNERLAREGYAVVPHLSARLVRDATHPRRCSRLQAAEVRELFVSDGDAPEPAGKVRLASLEPARL